MKSNPTKKKGIENAETAVQLILKLQCFVFNVEQNSIELHSSRILNMQDGGGSTEVFL